MIYFIFPYFKLLGMQPHLRDGALPRPALHKAWPDAVFVAPITFHCATE